MRIGPHILSSRLWLAPMAGVTDRPFRELCRGLGAGMAVSEMVSANPRLRSTAKTRRRLDHRGEPSPRAIQIAGANPEQLADMAQYNVDRGADIIDINMGCPAKKVCGAMAGSALLQDERLVARILDAVVRAVSVPVTLKIRTGPDPSKRNGVRVAYLAEQAGIAAIAVHGRTRKCGYGGTAEYATIRQIKARVGIPVIANGDIDSPERARFVLQYTGADAVMIGRAAQGHPWVFREVDYYLRYGQKLPHPNVGEVRRALIGHIKRLHEFYGEVTGVRVARKHLSWFCRGRPDAQAFWQRVNRVDSGARQIALTDAYFDELDDMNDLAA